jgi:hypothetical protein
VRQILFLISLISTEDGEQEIHTTDATPARISPGGHRRRHQRGAGGINITADAAPDPPERQRLFRPGVKSVTQECARRRLW